MCKDPNCPYCAPCKCGHKADEHLAGIGTCFKCNCEIWRDAKTGEVFAIQPTKQELEAESSK